MGYKKKITDIGLQMLSDSVNSGNVVFDSIVFSSSNINKDISNITINDFSNPYRLPINQVNKDTIGFTAVGNGNSQVKQSIPANVAGIVGHTNIDSTQQLIAIAMSDSDVPIFSVEPSQVSSYTVSFSIVYSKDADIVINPNNSSIANIDEVKSTVDSVMATYNQTSNIVANDNLDSKTKTGTYLLNNIDLSTLGANLGLPKIKINGALSVKNQNNLVSQTIEDTNGNAWSRTTGKAWGRLKSSELSNITTSDLSTLKNQDMFYNIMDYGAVRDDENFDNGAIINKIIAQIPNNGGTILIPNGKFFIKTPIQVNRNYIHIMGINRGLRSNIDPEVGQGLTHPGGGSRLILKNTLDTGIQIGVSGGSPRISGVEISNLNLLGANVNWGDHVSQTFIKGAQDSDNVKIHDNVIINVDYGIILNGADTPEIKNNWISELKNGIHLLGSSQQAQIEDNYLGCQPSGITLKLDGPYAANISGNNIYPDGYECIEINNGTICNITSNNIQSFYTGALKILGNNNIIASNLLYAKMNGGKWSSDPINRDGKFGFVQISGDANTFVSNHFISEQPVNDTRVLIKSGNGNVLKVNSIFGNASNSKIVVDQSANNNESIFNGITDSEFQNFGNNSNTNVQAGPKGVDELRSDMNAKFDALKTSVVLPSGTDLNNITDTGNYQLYWGYTYSNQPQLSGKTTQFIRVENNGNEIYQTAKHPWIDTFLVRKRTFGNWSAWTEIAGRSEVVSVIKQNYTAGSSLDNYTATGSYPMVNINLGALPSNLGLPASTINGVLQVSNEGSTGTQTIRDDQNNVWERQFYRSWHQISSKDANNATSADVTALQNQINAIKAKLGM